MEEVEDNDATVVYISSDKSSEEEDSEEVTETLQPQGTSIDDDEPNDDPNIIQQIKAKTVEPDEATAMDVNANDNIEDTNDNTTDDDVSEPEDAAVNTTTRSRVPPDHLNIATTATQSYVNAQLNEAVQIEHLHNIVH